MRGSQQNAQVSTGLPEAIIVMQNPCNIAMTSEDNRAARSVLYSDASCASFLSNAPQKAWTFTTSGLRFYRSGWWIVLALFL